MAYYLRQTKVLGTVNQELRDLIKQEKEESSRTPPCVVTRISMKNSSQFVRNSGICWFENLYIKQEEKN